MSWTAFHEFMPSCFLSLTLHAFIECRPHSARHSTGDTKMHHTLRVLSSSALPWRSALARPSENGVPNWAPAVPFTAATQPCGIKGHLQSTPSFPLHFTVSSYSLSSKNKNLMKPTFKIYPLAPKILLFSSLDAHWNHLGNVRC